MQNKSCKTKALIIDVRNYAHGTLHEIAELLNPKPRPFARVTWPVLDNPGAYRFEKTLRCGKRNRKAYRNKLVVLFNERTQSHGEFTVMALQNTPYVTNVGRQTDRADGNVAPLVLPSKLCTFMTRVGAYFPDGRPTQRIGLLPDHDIPITIEEKLHSHDEIFTQSPRYSRSMSPM